MAVIAPLLYRGTTRLGWALTAVVSGCLAVVSLWAAIGLSGDVARAAVVLGLALGYGWVTTGALELTLGRRAFIAVHGGSLLVVHDGLLGETLVVRRDDVDDIEVDRRSSHERRTAAGLRRGGVVPPTFLNPEIPVLSPSPSAHREDGRSVVPNVVVRFDRPLTLAPPARSVRFLLRMSQGRYGRYGGPKPRRTYEAVRLVVDGVDEIASALADWDPLDVEPRDERYLATVAEEHHRRHRRNRLLEAAGVAAITAVIIALKVLSRT